MFSRSLVSGLHKYGLVQCLSRKQHRLLLWEIKAFCQSVEQRENGRSIYGVLKEALRMSACICYANPLLFGEEISKRTAALEENCIELWGNMSTVIRDRSKLKSLD